MSTGTNNKCKSTTVTLTYLTEFVSFFESFLMSSDTWRWPVVKKWAGTNTSSYLPQILLVLKLLKNGGRRKLELEGAGRGVKCGLCLSRHFNGPPVWMLRKNRAKDKDFMSAIFNFNTPIYYCNALSIQLFFGLHPRFHDFVTENFHSWNVCPIFVDFHFHIGNLSSSKYYYNTSC